MSILTNRFKFHKSMPEGTLALFFIQIVSTLSYSVLYSTLVLYMKGKLGMSTSIANSIMGVFIAFNFGLHLLGGYFGGRFISNRALFCIGMVAQIIGCILLSFSSTEFLYYGLAAFLTGSGLNVTCVNCMLTQLFTPDDTRRETAFLWNYAGMNVGFFIGFSISGIFQIAQNYHSLFLLSSVGNFIALLFCFYSWNQLADKNTYFAQKAQSSKRRSNQIGLAFILLLPFSLSFMLKHADSANKLVIATGIAMFLLILYMAFKEPGKAAKERLIAFAALMVISTVFWMLYQIGPMGLTLFIYHNVQRSYGQLIIPPQWFENINTLVIVAGGPLLGVVLTKLRSNGFKINIPAQFALALLFIGIAFAILPAAIAFAAEDGMVHPSWIVASYVLQSIGELLISPIGYAMIGSLAPSSLQGIMMGMWMLNSGVGATLSSYSSNLMTQGIESTSPLATNPNYSHVFLMLGLFGIASAFILYLFVPKLRALMQEHGNQTMKEESVAVAS